MRRFLIVLVVSSVRCIVSDEPAITSELSTGSAETTQTEPADVNESSANIEFETSRISPTAADAVVVATTGTSSPRYGRRTSRHC